MTRIKLCGITRTEDIETINRLGPDYIGFVFWARSKRNIDRQTAAELKKLLVPDIKTVGVFVDEDVNTVAELMNDGIIDVAQRHPQLMTILLVRQEAYEQVTYQCRNQQIFVIAMPFKRQVLSEAASFMLRLRTVLDDKDRELVRLRKNLSEIRIITSAKIHLMQTKQMTEEEAHYYLEKEAMDRSLSKREVAEEILG